ncbi:MAG TPA: PilZ domain-containing protein [Myxococcota bacterium]|nr:PilZ domain-containing protein [Myxococcota bacterium]
MSQAERRRYLRAALNIFLNEDISTGSLLTRAMDIGEGGVRYTKPAGAFQRDSQDILLEFSLPGDDLPIRARGRVVRDRLDESTHSSSVVFTSLGARSAERIRNYVISRKRAELFESMRQQHLSPTAVTA